MNSFTSTEFFNGSENIHEDESTSISAAMASAIGLWIRDARARRAFEG
jgi:hypothetical protein